MPYINVKTNAVLDIAKKNTINSRISKAISLIPGKSEAYLMCATEDNATMMFRGDNSGKYAFVEVKLLGSSTREAYAELTAEICNILSQDADIDGKNCYVKFEEVTHWGMDGFLF